MKWKHRPRDARASRWIPLVPLTLAAVFVAAAVTNIAEQRAMRSPVVDGLAAGVDQLVPQGWAFFTKDPQTPRYRLYSLHDDELVDAIEPHTVGASSGYGFNRTYRNVAGEREAVERLLAEEDLTPCPDGDLRQCLDLLDPERPEHRMRSDARSPRFCGPYYVAVGPPVPWQWRHLVEGAVRTAHVTTIDIACPTA